MKLGSKIIYPCRGPSWQSLFFKLWRNGLKGLELEFVPHSGIIKEVLGVVVRGHLGGIMEEVLGVVVQGHLGRIMEEVLGVMVRGCLVEGP